MATASRTYTRVYSPADKARLVTAVCERVQDGELTEHACKAEGIAASTLRRWCAADDALGALYTHARHVSADALAEQAVGIATTGVGPDGQAYEDAQDKRLAYDALRWLAGKRRPREYGDRVDHEVSGGVQVLHLAALQSSASASGRALVPPVAPVSALPAATDMQESVTHITGGEGEDVT